MPEYTSKKLKLFVILKQHKINGIIGRKNCAFRIYNSTKK